MVTFKGYDKLKAGIFKSFHKTQTAYVVAGAFDYKLGKGFGEQISARGPGWKELSSRYIKRKKSDIPWVRTGKLLRSLEGNQITKVGTTRGIKYVFGSRQAGISSTVLIRYFRGRNPYAAFNKLNNERPLFVWLDSDLPHIQEDVARRLTEVMNGAGFVARTKKK